MSAATRHIQGAQPATSGTSNPVGNSEEVARLYTELINSFGSNDSEAVRLIIAHRFAFGDRARKSLPRWRGLPSEVGSTRCDPGGRD